MTVERRGVCRHPDTQGEKPYLGRGFWFSSGAGSAARRNAEALLNQSMKREPSFKLEQEHEYEAMVSKTAHLRELRLAKEAADKEAAALTSVAKARHRIKK
jgi:hypothetical protein